ncbi:hypothetical protein SS38_25640 [Enterobacter hormaechei subsp. xiangfangensis]|nr:hypothetical protein SS38_25640 [Enterobacter hormaechei subsp. xiangfangensis]
MVCATAYRLIALAVCYPDGTVISLPILQWVMPGAVQWSIRVTRWWIMLMVSLLSATLTQSHVQNAAGRGG